MLLLSFISLDVKLVSAQDDPAIIPVPEAYFKASNTGARDQFGDSIAISGNTVVVGAPYEDSVARGVNNANQGDGDITKAQGDSGAAYVFVQDSQGLWTQQAYLKASNADPGDKFGSAVAISGDTIVVAAPKEASSATRVNGNEDLNDAEGRGAVYVFVRDNMGNWSQQAYLKLDGPGNRFRFLSVAIDGDTLVISSPTEADGAHVYVRDELGNWSFQTHLKDEHIQSGNDFGISVGISGDFVIIGAPHESGNSAGAYIFVRDDEGNWSQEDFLKTPEFQSFGQVVDISGDTAIVGSNTETAYVFVRNNTGDWSQQTRLVAARGVLHDRQGGDFRDQSDNFGTSVAIEGNRIIVGASHEDSASRQVNGDETDNSARAAGAAYIFVRDDEGSWSQEAYLKAFNSEAGDFFGNRVAISSYSAIVGANFEDNNAKGINKQTDNGVATNSGAAYVFSLAPYFSVSDGGGEEDNGVISFTITRKGVTNIPASVEIETSDGTAIASDDYTPSKTTVNFAEYETRKTVNVSILPDNIVEPDETFSVNLSNPSAGVILDGQGVGTILDDEVPEFSVNDAQGTEGENIVFTVTRGGNTAVRATVDVNTVADSATEDVDYSNVTGQVVFAENETEQTVTVATIDDDDVEGDETFSVNLSNPSAGVILDDQGVGTILDNDDPPEPTVEATKEVTPEATHEPTATATPPEPTVEATKEVTPEATHEPTTTATPPEPTVEATKEVTPEATHEPTTTATPPETPTPLPPRADGAPHAPRNIVVVPRQGQPLIQWDDDVNAQWYNFVIFGEPGNPTLHNLWYSKPGVPLTTADYAQVKCNEGICLLDLPETKPLIGGGQYWLWMQAWGTPDGTFAAGLWSKGGKAQYKGVMYEAYNATSFNLPATQPQQPDPKGITVTNADTGQPTIGWQAADNVIWYQVWIGSQINGEYTSYHFQDWTFAGDLGCIDPKSQCTFALPSPLSNGTSRLLAGTYEVWLNSWGPAGFAVSSIPDVPNHQGWAKLTELTVGS